MYVFADNAIRFATLYCLAARKYALGEIAQRTESNQIQSFMQFLYKVLKNDQEDQEQNTQAYNEYNDSAHKHQPRTDQLQQT